MPAMEMFCQLIGVKINKLSKEEILVIEAEIFLRICSGLKEIIKSQNTEYFRLMKFDEDMENTMVEHDFIRCVINDILATEEYTLSGIAYYTQIPEEVIYEIAIGRNISPSITLSQKIINLHRTVRPNLYREIIKKITAEFLTAA